eukprot:9499212-Ditylum_brightwellii.AAC.1
MVRCADDQKTHGGPYIALGVNTCEAVSPRSTLDLLWRAMTRPSTLHYRACWRVWHFLQPLHILGRSLGTTLYHKRIMS